MRNTPLSDLEGIEGNENAAQTTYGGLITLFFFVKIINSKERRPINEKQEKMTKKQNRKQKNFVIPNFRYFPYGFRCLRSLK